MSDDASAPVQVDTADTVNVNTPGPSTIPYVRYIIWVSFFILAIFAIISGIVIFTSPSKTGVDAATKGSIINTWNNLAVMAATFWVGSSLAGKMQRSSSQ